MKRSIVGQLMIFILLFVGCGGGGGGGGSASGGSGGGSGTISTGGSTGSSTGSTATTSTGGSGTATGGSGSTSGGSGTTTGGVPIPPPPTVGDLVVRHTILTRAVPTNVEEMRFVGLDIQGTTVYGPDTRAKASEIILMEVPLETVSLRIEYLQNGALVGLGQIEVVMDPDTPFVVTDPPFDDVPAQLVELILSTDRLTLAKGTSTSLTVQGLMNTGETEDFTLTAVWTVSDSEVGEFTGSTLDALEIGNTDFKASVGPVEVSGSLEVTAAELSQLRFIPPTLSLPAGRSAGFQLEGLYTDNSTQVLDVQPASSQTEIAVLTTATEVKALSQGEASLDVLIDGISASLPVEVTPALLEGLSIRPTSYEIPKGYSQYAKAYASYSDGSELDVTSQVVWSADETAVATVSNVETPGLVAARTVGSTTLRATLDAFQAEAPVEVSQAVLDRIIISPDSLTLNVGFHSLLTAEGVWSDGTTMPLDDLYWTSQDTNKAIVSLFGAVEARGPGVTTISVEKSGVIGTIEVEVLDRRLTSISLGEDMYINTNVGVTEQLQALGTFDDGQIEDISGEVLWWSSRENILETLGGGRFLAYGLGRSFVSASLGGLREEVGITVDDAVVVSIDLTGPSGVVPVGVDLVYRVEATYSDGSTRDVTNSVSWGGFNSSQWERNPGPSNAYLKPLIPGIYNLSCSYRGAGDSLVVDVQDLGLDSIEVVDTPLSLPTYVSYRFRAFGNFSNGTRYPIDSSVTWSTTGHPDATIAANGSFGSGVPGVATVVATHKTLPGESGQGTATVSHSKPASVEIVGSTYRHLRVGDREEIEVRVTYDNGFQEVSDHSVLFDSYSNPSDAFSIGSGGNMSITGPGTGYISARVRDASGNDQYAYVQIEVQEGHPEAFVFPDRNLTLPTDLCYQLVCLALVPTGEITRQYTDYTGSLQWSSSVPRVATVSNEPGSKGLLTTRDEGYTVIKVRDPKSGLESQIGVTVKRKNLVELKFDQGPTFFRPGSQRRLEVFAHYEDGSSYEVGQALDWTSGDTGVLTVSTVGVKGTLSFLGMGTAIVEVRDPKSGVTASQPIQVSLDFYQASASCPTPIELKLSRDASKLFAVTKTSLRIFDSSDLTLIHQRSFTDATSFAESLDSSVIYVGQERTPTIVEIDLETFAETAHPFSSTRGVLGMEMVQSNYLVVGLVEGGKMATLRLSDNYLSQGPTYGSDPYHVEAIPGTQDVLVSTRGSGLRLARYSVNATSITKIDDASARGYFGIDIAPSSGKGYFAPYGPIEGSPDFAVSGTLFYDIDDLRRPLAAFGYRFRDVAFSSDEAVIYGAELAPYRDLVLRLGSLTHSTNLGSIPLSISSGSFYNFIVPSADGSSLFVHMGDTSIGDPGSIQKIRVR